MHQSSDALAGSAVARGRIAPVGPDCCSIVPDGQSVFGTTENQCGRLDAEDIGAKIREIMH